MSSQAAIQFLQKVSEDAQLQEEVAKVMSSGGNAQPLVEIGAKHGCQFTSEEITQEIQNRQKAAVESGELNEDELEAVAGGGAGAVVSKMLTKIVTKEVTKEVTKAVAKKI